MSCLVGDGLKGRFNRRMRRLLRRARLVRCDQRGATAVEFAVIGSVLIFLIAGIVEFSLVMVVTNSLEASTSISSRVGKTGFADTGLSREETILAEIEKRAGGLIDIDDVEITSQSYESFDEIGKPEPWNDANSDGVPDDGEYTDINGNGQWDQDMGVAGFGGSDEVVVYNIKYDWEIITPLMREVIGGSDGAVSLSAQWVVKNEPF
ncbi:MAG: pilus assembly protein [Alphaproteobacteria bacterium]|nr:pilus assembly protein [Alphaproteobacteria bacterium]